MMHNSLKLGLIEQRIENPDIDSNICDDKLK